MRRAICGAALLVALMAAVAGCGSGGSGNTVSEVEQKQEKSTKEVAEESRAAEAKAPEGASPTLRAIYRSFPAPQTAGLKPAALKVLEASEAACKGKTPIEVKEEFYAEAKANLESAQAQMIGKIAEFEAQAKSDRSFVAGQLAADTYAATIPGALATVAYRGCIHSLATRLERELAPEGN